jgi:hypothetical protein
MGQTPGFEHIFMQSLRTLVDYYLFFSSTIICVYQSIENVGIQITLIAPLDCSRRDAEIVTTYETTALNSSSQN